MSTSSVPGRCIRIGIGTCDLFVGLVVQPGLSCYAWKDEGEYAQARRLGLIDDAVRAAVDEARQQVLVLIEGRQGAIRAGPIGMAARSALGDTSAPK